MTKPKKKWKKVLVIIAVVLSVLVGGGFLGLEYLKSELKAAIKGCELASKDFKTVIDFEYVNNWIVVKVKVGGSDKEYPFIFDTGAQTIILDSLLKDIGKDRYKKYFTSKKSDTTENAFDGGLISLYDLQMGDVKFRDIGAITAKNSKWAMLNCISAYGIIGYNIIQTCSFQIDYEKKQITLTDNVESLANFDDIQWMDYTPVSTQETPLVPAVINDSIKINLLFDTGMSGGISLNSENLYNDFSWQFPERTVKYISTPSLRIRGETAELQQALLYKASSFSMGSYISEDVKINIENAAEREYSGLIGNKYFENYIITLDYKNRRLGFIPTRKMELKNSSYGLSYLPSGEKMIVSSIFAGFAPEKAGLRPGDEIHAINGIVISELPSETFCEIYRREFNFKQPGDTLLQIDFIKNDTVVAYGFKKQRLFE